AVDGGAAESDRLVALASRDADAPLATGGPRARIGDGIGHGRDLQRKRARAAQYLHSYRRPAGSLDDRDEIIPTADGRAVHRDDAVALLETGERRRFVGHHEAQPACRGVLVSLYESHIYDPTQNHVHRDAGQHYDEP